MSWKKNSKVRILLAGANGIVGRALIDAARRREGFEVLAVSRGALRFLEVDRCLQLDLTDFSACMEAADQLKGATHLVYAAWQPSRDAGEQVRVNALMFRNLMETMATAPDLAHVTLLQGMKAYGSHLGTFRTPALESDPRHMGHNFYYEQQDDLVRIQAGKSWSWTVLRPVVICGFSLASSMNLTNVLAVYATLCKEMGWPLRFPGSEKAYGILRQFVSSDLVAEAILWAATAPQCANEIFNIANGDHFRWRNLWPRVADWFGLDPTFEEGGIVLGDILPSMEENWERIVQKNGLKATAWNDMASWNFADYSLGREHESLADTLKARSFGFNQFRSTEEMFLEQLQDMVSRKFIPPFSP
jgi:nucleoside-diphosphate-sugar epimerase